MAKTFLGIDADWWKGYLTAWALMLGIPARPPEWGMLILASSAMVDTSEEDLHYPRLTNEASINRHRST